MSGEKNDGDLKIIKEWLLKQPHLPQNIHHVMLKRFLHACNNSIEQTKTLIDLFYTIRSQAPEIFDNRDPTKPEIQEVFANIDFIPMPKLTKNKHKVFVYRILTNDPEKYNFVNGVKAFFIFADVRMVEEQDFPEGEIPIFDMKNFTVRHLTKIVLPVVKKYMVYTQEAHPIKLREIHVINVPPFLDRCLAIIRPFLKSDVAKMVSLNQETLYEYVARDFLPDEYGGTAGKIPDIKSVWYQKIIANRDYLLDDSRWKVDENQRPVENNNRKQLFGMQGSFRTLTID
ncbi:hypothetical protein NQ314_004166 [Rhamnusium bicolor]|uniref:CRAL-TRIO domain-containing protein n=1 Tax=Rhamnusium bicolor TaxID=1586634 RepID=A0AAV8ZLV3_9CUCU|nr:hypothetical protein NQ314_004166 [Rhamnusium bicolor]